MPFPFYTMDPNSDVLFLGAFVGIELFDLALRYPKAKIVCVEHDAGYLSELQKIADTWSLQNLTFLRNEEEAIVLLGKQRRTIGYLRSNGHFTKAGLIERIVKVAKVEFGYFNFPETPHNMAELVSLCRSTIQLSFMHDQYGHRKLLVRAESRTLFSIVVQVDTKLDQARTLLEGWVGVFARDAQYIIVCNDVAAVSERVRGVVAPEDLVVLQGDNPGTDADFAIGLSSAKGKYVIFASPSDQPLPTARDSLVLAQASCEFDVAIGGYTVILPDSQKNSHYASGDFGKDVRWRAGPLALEESVSSDAVLSRSVYRTDFAQGIKSRMTTSTLSDFEFHNTAVAQANSIVSVSDLLIRRNWLRCVRPLVNEDLVAKEIEGACVMIASLIPSVTDADSERKIYDVTIKRSFRAISEFKSPLNKRAALKMVVSQLLKTKGRMSGLQKVIYLSRLSDRTLDILKLNAS